MFLGKYHIPWWIFWIQLCLLTGRVSRNSAARMCKIIWNFNPTQSHKVAARERVARGRRSEKPIGGFCWLDSVFVEGSLFSCFGGEKLTHLYGNSTVIYYIACSIYIYIYRHSWTLCKLIFWMFFLFAFFRNGPSSWRNPISTINHFLIWDGNGVVSFIDVLIPSLLLFADTKARLTGSVAR